MVTLRHPTQVPVANKLNVNFLLQIILRWIVEEENHVVGDKLLLDFRASSGGEHGHDGHGVVGGEREHHPDGWSARSVHSSIGLTSASGSLPLGQGSGRLV